MGADSHRRFYRGRPKMCEVSPSLPTPPATPRSQHRNQQRQRQRQHLDTGNIQELRQQLQNSDGATVSCSCRALARMCRDDEGREAAADLLEPLVVALQAHGENDAAVARHGCTAIVGICRSSADDQARAAALGAFAAAAACARVHPQHLTQACAAVEGLCTGKGAAARRELAIAAGWLELLVAACGEADVGPKAEAERTRHAARAALRSITRDSLHLQQAALDAGAEREWLI